MTSTPVDPLIAAVNAAIGRVGPGLYGVACSGGADSLALADAAIAVAGAAHVVVLVIDHRLAEGSTAIAERVATWARERGAAAVVRRVTVARGASLEAAARTARYAALEELADELGLACVMLGHTARDQAETVLMRIVRGTGPAGLAGIAATRGRFVRPLLALERAAVDAYVAARALPVWDDPMNADPAFARVRMRREILPLLRRENPQLDAALVRLADSAAEWLAVIDRAAAPFARFPIACSALAKEPPAIRKRALALALEQLGYAAVHLEQIDRAIMAPPRGTIRIEIAGAVLVKSYDTLELERDHPPATLAAPDGYLLRTWQPGDRMRLARLKGRSRKLSDLYIDAKVPQPIRATARVLVRISDATIVWAEHLGVAFEETIVPAQTAGSF